MLFNRLLKPNADYAIDFHTSTTGIDMTALHIARMDLPEVRAMAELFPIDQIFDNAAYPGILANAFIDAGIPAFTPEIGAARILDHDMIPLFVEGTMNVLKHHSIIAGHKSLCRQQRSPCAPRSEKSSRNTAAESPARSRPTASTRRRNRATSS